MTRPVPPETGGTVPPPEATATPPGGTAPTPPQLKPEEVLSRYMRLAVYTPDEYEVANASVSTGGVVVVYPMNKIAKGLFLANDQIMVTSNTPTTISYLYSTAEAKELTLKSPELTFQPRGPNCFDDCMSFFKDSRQQGLVKAYKSLNHKFKKTAKNEFECFDQTTRLLSLTLHVAGVQKEEGGPMLQNTVLGASYKVNIPALFAVVKRTDLIANEQVIRSLVDHCVARKSDLWYDYDSQVRLSDNLLIRALCSPLAANQRGYWDGGQPKDVHLCKYFWFFPDILNEHTTAFDYLPPDLVLDVAAVHAGLLPCILWRRHDKVPDVAFKKFPAVHPPLLVAVLESMQRKGAAVDQCKAALRLLANAVGQQEALNMKALTPITAVLKAVADSADDAVVRHACVVAEALWEYKGTAKGPFTFAVKKIVCQANLSTVHTFKDMWEKFLHLGVKVDLQSVPPFAPVGDESPEWMKDATFVEAVLRHHLQLSNVEASSDWAPYKGAVLDIANKALTGVTLYITTAETVTALRALAVLHGQLDEGVPRTEAVEKLAKPVQTLGAGMKFTMLARLVKTKREMLEVVKLLKQLGHDDLPDETSVQNVLERVGHWDEMFTKMDEQYKTLGQCLSVGAELKGQMTMPDYSSAVLSDIQTLYDGYVVNDELKEVLQNASALLVLKERVKAVSEMTKKQLQTKEDLYSVLSAVKAHCVSILEKLGLNLEAAAEHVVCNYRGLKEYFNKATVDALLQLCGVDDASVMWAASVLGSLDTQDKEQLLLDYSNAFPDFLDANELVNIWVSEEGRTDLTIQELADATQKVIETSKALHVAAHHKGSYRIVADLKKKVVPVLRDCDFGGGSDVDFVRFLEVALDEAADDPKLQAVLQDMKIAREVAFELLATESAAAALSVIEDEGFKAYVGSHDNLMHGLHLFKTHVADLKDGGKQLRELQAINNGQVLLTNLGWEPKLELQRSDGKVEPHQRWRDLLQAACYAQIEEAKQLATPCMDVLEAAENMLAVHVDCIQAGVPSAHRMAGGGELSFGSVREVKDLAEGMRANLQAWELNFSEMAATSPALLCIPVRSLLQHQPPFGLDDSYPLCAARMERMACFRPPSPSAKRRHLDFTLTFHETLETYLGALTVFAQGTQLPTRWQLLLCDHTTSLWDVRQFVKRVRDVPDTLYVVTDFVDAPALCQKELVKLLKELEGELSEGTSITFVGARLPAILEEGGLRVNVTVAGLGACAKVSAWLAQRPLHVRVYTSEHPGEGKSRRIKDDLPTHRRGMVTLNGEASPDCFKGKQQFVDGYDQLVLRVADSLSADKTERTDRLLFEALITQSVIDSTGHVHALRKDVYVETRTLTPLLRAFNVTWVVVRHNERPQGMLSHHKRTHNIFRRGTCGQVSYENVWRTLERLSENGGDPLTMQHYKMAQKVVEYLIKNGGLRRLDRCVDLIFSRIMRTAPVEDMKLLEYADYMQADELIWSYYAMKKKPPSFPHFIWSPQVADLAMQLDVWHSANIPLILEGETGCGKTELVKFWSAIRNHKLEVMTIHGGYTEEYIMGLIKEKTEAAASEYSRTRKPTILFLDEMNTSPAVDLIKEAMYDQRMNGASLRLKGYQNHIRIIGAINPDRCRTQKEIDRFRYMGLHVMAGGASGVNLADKVYRVHALTRSDFHVEFPDMDQQTLKRCIAKRLPGHEVVEAAHLFLKLSPESDYRFVSFRDLNFFEIVYDELLRLKEACVLNLSMDECAVAAACTVYAAKLRNRKKLYEKIGHNAEEVFERIQETFAHAMRDHVPEGVVMNNALRENIYMMAVCISKKIPLFIVGPPGTSKSLSKAIVASAMQGKRSTTLLLRQLPAVQLRVLQCSPHTTTRDIEQHFESVDNMNDGVVVLEEAGLAEMSREMPLKVLHQKLDARSRPVLLMSNWQVDPAKMNRGLFIMRATPTAEELKATAREFLKQECGDAADEAAVGVLQRLSEAFVATTKVMSQKKEFPEGSFYALRDYYSCISSVVQGNVVDTSHVMKCVYRNFAGLPHLPQEEVDALFRRAVGGEGDLQRGVLLDDSLEAALTALGEPKKARYPLLIAESMGAALGCLRGQLDNEVEVVCGSGFEGDKGLDFTQALIRRMRAKLNSGTTFVVMNANTAYESMYDLFNKFYTSYGQRQYVDIGVGHARIKVEVHRDTKLLLLCTEEDAYGTFPPPLLNRFEKHRFFTQSAEGFVGEVRKQLAELGRGKCIGVSDEGVHTARVGAVAADEEDDDEAAIAVCAMLQDCMEAPAEKHFTSLTAYLEWMLEQDEESRKPAHLTVAEEGWKPHWDGEGRVEFIDAGLFKREQEFEKELNEVTGTLPVVLLREAGRDLFTSVENTVRNLGRAMVLVTGTSVRRALDGFWQQAHVDTFSDSAWRGMGTAVCNGALTAAIEAYYSEAKQALVTDPAVKVLLEAAPQLLLQVVGKQAPENEDWVHAVVASDCEGHTTLASKVKRYLEKKLKDAINTLRLGMVQQECDVLEKHSEFVPMFKYLVQGMNLTDLGETSSCARKETFFPFAAKLQENLSMTLEEAEGLQWEKLFAMCQGLELPPLPAGFADRWVTTVSPRDALEVVRLAEGVLARGAHVGETQRLVVLFAIWKAKELIGSGVPVENIEGATCANALWESRTGEEAAAESESESDTHDTESQAVSPEVCDASATDEEPHALESVGGLSLEKGKLLLATLQAEKKPTVDAKAQQALHHMYGMLDRSLALHANDTASDDHFVAELLQNFDDNSYAEGQVARAQLEFKDEEVVLMCNEVGMGEDDFRALCDVGCSTKKKNSGFIGEKGIGFKSAFRVSDTPKLVSGGLRFKFDRKQPLGYIYPLGLDDEEELQLVKRLDECQMVTAVALPLVPACRGKQWERSIDPLCLIFFRRLREIRVTSHESDLRWTCDTEHVVPTRVCTLKVCDAATEHIKSAARYVIFEEKVQVGEHRSDARSHLDKSTITLAFPCEGPSAGKRVYNFLPVRDVGLPFVCNLDLLLTANRREFHEDEDWNTKLREHLVDVLCHALASRELRLGLKVPPVAFLPPAQLPDPFFRSVGDALYQRLEHVQCIEVVGGDVVTPSEAAFTRGGPAAAALLRQINGVKATVEDISAVPKVVVTRLAMSEWSASKMVKVVAESPGVYATRDAGFFVALLRGLMESEKGMAAFARTPIWPAEGAESLHTALSLCIEGDTTPADTLLRGDVAAALCEEERSFLVYELGMRRCPGEKSTRAMQFESTDTLLNEMLHDVRSADPEAALGVYLALRSKMQKRGEEGKTLLRIVGKEVKLRTRRGSYAPAGSLYLDEQLHEALGEEGEAVVVSEDYDAEERQVMQRELGVAGRLRVVDGEMDPMVVRALGEDVTAFLVYIDKHWQVLRPSLSGKWPNFSARTVRTLSHGAVKLPNVHIRSALAAVPVLACEVENSKVYEMAGLVSQTDAASLVGVLKMLQSQELLREVCRKQCVELYKELDRAHRNTVQGMKNKVPVMAAQGWAPVWDKQVFWEGCNGLEQVYGEAGLGYFFIEVLGVRKQEPMEQRVRRVQQKVGSTAELESMLLQLNSEWAGMPQNKKEELKVLPIYDELAESLACPSRGVIVCDVPPEVTTPVDIYEAHPGSKVVLLSYEFVKKLLNTRNGLLDDCVRISEYTEGTVSASNEKLDATKTGQLKCARDLALLRVRASCPDATLLPSEDETVLRVGVGGVVQRVKLIMGLRSLSANLTDFKELMIFDRLQCARPYFTVGSVGGGVVSEVDPYQEGDKVLVLGDGNFSFARALCRNAGPTVVASTLALRDADDATRDEAKQLGCHVVERSVDATSSSLAADLGVEGNTPFDFVVFNFPHTGVAQYSDTVQASIDSNRRLLRDVLGNLAAQPGLVAPHTKIHVTIKGSKYPYTSWNIIDQAVATGWKCVRQYPFPAQHYQDLGYSHQTTRRLYVRVNVKDAITYEFARGL